MRSVDPSLKLSRWRSAIAVSLLPLLSAGIAIAAEPAQYVTAVAATGPVSARAISRLLMTDVVQAGKRLVAIGEQGYIVYSDDGGQAWTRAANPRRTMLTSVRFVDAMHGWVVGHDGLILATRDGGSTWAEQRFAPDEEKPLLGVWFKDANTGIAVGAYGLYLETADGGKSWNEREILLDLLGDDGADRHLNAISAVGGNRLVIAGEAGTVLTSTDGGATWTAPTAPYQGSYFGVIALQGQAMLLYGLRGQAFRSEDGGATWTAAAGAGPVTLLGGSAQDDGTVLLVGAAGSVRVSHDGGRTFEAKVTDNPSAFSTALLLDAGRALVVGEAGPRILTLAPAANGAQP